jgi:hypothetical protein
MPQTPQKRGRPSKYASNEEKAREDVIKKRARRRLQSATARRDIRFQFYNTKQIQAVAPLSVHQAHLQSSNGLNILADAAISLQSRVAVSEPRASQSLLQTQSVAAAAIQTSTLRTDLRYLLKTCHLLIQNHCSHKRSAPRLINVKQFVLI